MRAIERGDAESLTSVRPDVPAEIADVVERSMSTDPFQRFDSASAMAAALAPPPAVEVPVAPESPVDLDATVAIDLRPRDGNTMALPRTDAPKSPRRPFGRVPNRRVAFVAAVAALTALVIGVSATQSDSARPGIPAKTVATGSAPATTVTTGSTPANTLAPATTKLPAPLDTAIRHLEQEVGK
jgi:serine/threonine-protein kinase